MAAPNKGRRIGRAPAPGQRRINGGGQRRDTTPLTDGQIDAIRAQIPCVGCGRQLRDQVIHKRRCRLRGYTEGADKCPECKQKRIVQVRHAVGCRTAAVEAAEAAQESQQRSAGRRAAWLRDRNDTQQDSA